MDVCRIGPRWLVQGECRAGVEKVGCWVLGPSRSRVGWKNVPRGIGCCVVVRPEGVGLLGEIQEEAVVVQQQARQIDVGSL